MLDISLVQALINMILALFGSKIPTGVGGFLGQLTANLPGLVAAGADVDAFLKAQFAILQTMIDENRDPTQAEWDELDAAKLAELTKLEASATPPRSMIQ